MARIAASQGDRIVAHLEACGVGLIYTEIAQALSMADVAVNRRLAELRAAGRVQRLADTRLTPSGRPAHVYIGKKVT
jgi:predicted ArsR family transcriptional regulator